MIITPNPKLVYYENNEQNTTLPFLIILDGTEQPHDDFGVISNPMI